MAHNVQKNVSPTLDGQMLFVLQIVIICKVLHNF
jgi:hypothetical protein